ncbi:MAG: hypothetical protein IPG10_20230 [Flavobacteriales bacterium]|nr:hypothetical protein [Flavobacteriales bacterium]
MDTPRGLNEREADGVLRDLFQEVGSLSAPERLEQLIMQRIALLPRNTLLPERPLLPKWSWYLAAALVCGVMLSGGSSTVPTWLSHLPSVNWKTALPWMQVGLGACVALLALDAWLNRRRSGELSR